MFTLHLDLCSFWVTWHKRCNVLSKVFVCLFAFRCPIVPHHLLESYPLSTGLSVFFCQRSHAYIYIVLLLDFHPLHNLFVYFSQILCCIDYWSLIVSLEVRWYESFNFVLFQYYVGYSKTYNYSYIVPNLFANIYK